ncbi:hypothetical protein CAPTEDRAFT_110937 [Capitella teleta]|uniref:Uncharacterized protein n=1 Tax=Capitella teleta TaxID=283909 RepID=R7TWZ1_CAPTE|nr:hypothetical protein CAPTEDRAFT_110937 [Capitella teleta]|eukprot:ELT98249.1 hypothetical protein CAPTEDRAFT_110937 [Capitella teleta]
MSSCSNSSFSSDFKESLPLISQAIQDASFVSIDCEMTGDSLLTSLLCLIQSGFESHWMDTPEDRYNKLRQGAMPFNVIQFGLCTFNKKEDSKQYSVHAFNFYIFPRPVNSDATDVRFTCQV